MKNALDSKTMAGLILLLAFAGGFAAFGLLTEELVDVIRWVGAAYMGVRVAANLPNGGGK